MGVRANAFKTVGWALEGPGPSSKRSGVLIGEKALRWAVSTCRREFVVAKALIGLLLREAYAVMSPGRSVSNRLQGRAKDSSTLPHICFRQTTGHVIKGLDDGAETSSVGTKGLHRNDVAIFKGSAAGSGNGIVHRSPPIVGTGHTRLLLCLNQRTEISPAPWPQSDDTEAWLR